MIKTLKEFARESARRYLQSAVFVDDEIFDVRSGKPVAPTDLPKPRKPVFRPEAVEEHTQSGIQETTDLDENEQFYHPKELVSSFAREGVICALYEPPEGFPTGPDSEIFKLCERSDIIILDWDFSGAKGQKALDLITALVKQSNEEFPHHIRLLSIYTSDPSLTAVANSIADRLRKEGCDAQPEGSQCRLRFGATRLVVFGKNVARFGEEEFTVEEAELANRLIEEFADMNSGILPSYALHGMAAIRRNSKRILDRFHGDMDGAFLLHRRFVADSEEAFDQLPELLADELRAIIEDEHLDSDDVEHLAMSALENNLVSVQDKELIESGAKPAKVARQLIGNQESNLSGHHHLAALFANRMQYSRASRILTHGTVIRRHQKAQDSWIYALCLMPACDSLRLDPKKKACFPFWTLQQSERFENSKGRGMVLFLPDGSPIELTAGGKASDMFWTAKFKVDKATRTVKAVFKDGSFKFAGPKFEIEWVGQLKPLHAQRIAHDIGQSLSRIGLAEAEWLRLLCDR
jgi:hypothetical protein